MTRSKIARVHDFFNRFEKADQVLVAINADPDAMAGAMAVKRLLWKRVASVTPVHVNVIERPDNIAFINLLGIHLKYKDDIEIGNYNRYVLVDSQPTHHEWFSRFEADVIIDHHPDESTDLRNSTMYNDTRPAYGAVSTMMIEYLRAARIIPSINLATALYLGIKSDTGNFERHAQIEDVRAFQSIYKHVNVHLARRIEQADIAPEALDCFLTALKRRVMKKGWIFSHMGRVDNPDVCVLVADFFMRVNTVKWSIVSGIYGQILVVILRNNGIRRDAGKTAKKVFGKMGSAGGHKSMARAEINLNVFRDVTGAVNRDEIQGWIIGQLLP